MNELEKLRVLLPHWIEHNHEHTQAFRTWAERAKASHHEHAAQHLGCWTSRAIGRIAWMRRIRWCKRTKWNETETKSGLIFDFCVLQYL